MEENQKKNGDDGSFMLKAATFIVEKSVLPPFWYCAYFFTGIHELDQGGKCAFRVSA